MPWELFVVIECYLGIDIGTSGVRAILINRDAQILASASTLLPPSTNHEEMLCQQPEDWWHAVIDCLQQITTEWNCSGLQAMAIDGGWSN